MGYWEELVHKERGLQNRIELVTRDIVKAAKRIKRSIEIARK
jgi:hypothetical protein